MPVSGSHDCWSYDDPADFRAHAAEFLRAGAAGGERVWYVAAEPAPAVLDAIGAAGRFVDVSAAYGTDHVVDPAAQVAAYAAATEAALAAGYTGLRVAAEVSTLVRTPAQLDAFARYEFAIGRYMLTAPFRAVCGYDRVMLGAGAVAEAACLHPRSTAGATPFHLHPAAPDAVYLDGELDAAAEDLFTGALRRAAPTHPLTVHGDGLRFIDHRSLLALDRHAAQHDTCAVVRTPHTSARRLAGLLQLRHVRVEVIA